MISSLRALFQAEGITLYKTLPLSACKIQKPYLLSSFPTPPQSVLLVAIPYRSGAQCARLSKYAISKDYHLYFQSLWERCVARLKQDYPAHHFVGYHDHAPIAEVDAAVRCGLGVRGDNGLLITEQYGSYIFLGEIVSNLPYTEAFVPQSGECLHCNRCRTYCPSSDNCLSAITQKKQALSEAEIALMKKHQSAWGCDICQDVCPMNQGKATTPISFFLENLITEFTVDSVSAMSDAEFSERAFAWRGRECVMRNLRLLEEDDEKS